MSDTHQWDIQISDGPPPNCEEYTNQIDCEAADCYWYDGACHSGPYGCSQLTNQVDCEAAGCYWYDGACHSDYPPPPPPEIPWIIVAGGIFAATAIAGIVIWKMKK